MLQEQGSAALIGTGDRECNLLDPAALGRGTFSRQWTYRLCLREAELQSSALLLGLGDLGFDDPALHRTHNAFTNLAATGIATAAISPCNPSAKPANAPASALTWNALAVPIP